MTTDAKVGLLLGLIFIFLIAFIINGLPNFNSDKDNSNELTSKMVIEHNNPSSISRVEKKEVIRTFREEEQERAKAQTIQREGFSIEPRFKFDLPKVKAVAKETVKIEEELKNKAKVQFSKFYIVEEGDSLSSVAKRFYGAQEGNKKINIERIYEANRRYLKSADNIYVGQKLMIPSLTRAIRDKGKGSVVVAMLQKVKTVSKREKPEKSAVTGRSRRYKVKAGDSLWTIASKELDNPNRYDEIIELNSDVLEDEDNLSVGMSLKIPAR